MLASCAPPAPVSVTPTVSAAPTAIPHADAIRFALVGQPAEVNVWSLFDESGASYANYALHSDEYPRLYRLSIPEREFEPYIAEGMPSAVTQEGDFFTATASLQDGLTWSDGSPLSAADVAFTVNTALAFRLRYDWRSAYNPDLLDHAESVDDGTVKFYFNRPFNVGHWQYGALQGPVVNQVYWSPRLTEAVALLPAQELIDSLGAIRVEAGILQARVDADNLQLLNTQPNSETYNELGRRVVRNQDELNSLNSRLVGLQDEYDAAQNAARAALFALDDDGEPTFGPFLRAAQAGDTFVRETNPAYPFEKPNFDRGIYKAFDGELSALMALKDNEADLILAANGLPTAVDGSDLVDDPSIVSVHNYASSVRFIVINPSNSPLGDPAFRRALYCAINHGVFGNYFPSERASASFVARGNEAWLNPGSYNLCASGPVDRMEAVQILKAAGYSWQKEPRSDSPGEGLLLPDGRPFPEIALLAPDPELDWARGELPAFIQLYLRDIGISLTVRSAGAEDLRYAVYSSGDYDMAILGWRLSEYPGYLCEWFQAPGPFMYGSDKLASACESFNSTADLELAQQASSEIQSLLMEDLPFIPLYQVLRYEVHRGVTFPFDATLDGLSGLYGAPALAIPAP